MRVFEDEFMDFQSSLISLCVEVLEGRKVDRIFAYCSTEKHSTMFNAFFEDQGNVLTLKQVGIGAELAMQFLSVGTDDLDKLEEICNRYGQPVPTEMKLVYEMETHKFDASYKYEPVCPADSDLCAEEVFEEWENEISSRKQ